MEENTPAPSPRSRRLPTKTRSGIISLPPAIGDDESGPTSSTSRLMSPLMSPSQSRNAWNKDPIDDAPSSTRRATAETFPTTFLQSSSQGLIGDPSSREGIASPWVGSLSPRRNSEVHWSHSSVSSESRLASSVALDPATSEDPPHQRDVGAPPTYKYGPPKQAPKPAPLPTGPLNSTSTPQVQSLPVQRRGSYAALKRQSGKGEESSVVEILKKASHWEVWAIYSSHGISDD